jgi:ribosomal protein S16
MVYAYDGNLLADNIDTIKKNTDTLFGASKDVSLEANAEKTKYMLLSHHQNAGQNRNIKRGDRSFENMGHFKCLRTTVTNQNLIQEEIKRRLNSGNASYHSVQHLLSSHLLYKSIQIRIYSYKTIILSVVLHGCETWSLTLRREHILRMFEESGLR